MAINPNFPVLDYAISWAAGPNQSPVQPYWCSVLERTDAAQGQVAGQRGKQYSTDQVQPGNLGVTLANRDGALDPANTSSPFNGYVVPYRLFRLRAQWSPTQNLFTQNQATAGEAAVVSAPQVEQPWGTGAIPDSNSIAQNATYPTTIIADGSAFQGANVYQTSFPAAAAYGVGVMGLQNFSVTPATTVPAVSTPHTFSARARSKTASITTTAQLQVQWLTAAGTVISTVNGTTASLAAGTSAAWTTLAVTASPPVNAAGGVVNLIPASGPATAWLLQSDGWQFEKAAAATTFVVPGTWYPLFTGYVQEWPQRWTASGNYGVSDLIVVDVFAFFSQRNLLAPFKADLMALNPNFLYALDETAGTNAFADATGKRGAAVFSRSGVANSILAGGSVASGDNAPPGPDQNTALTGAFLGAPGPVLQTAAPPGPASAGYPTPSAALEIPPNPATGNTGPPSSGAYTRLIAARATSLQPVGSPGLVIWAPSDPTGAYGSPLIQTDVPAGTQAEFSAISPNSLGPNYGLFALPKIAPVSALVDTDWHLLGWSLSSDGLTAQLWADGNPNPVTVTSAAPMWQPVGPPSAGYNDTLAAEIFTNGTVNGFWQGQLAFACELPIAMTGAIWSALARSWRNAWATSGSITETSNGRYSRILTWLGYTGPTRISTGLCKSVGPATDIAVSTTSPTAGLQALQNVVDTESGQHFVSSDGAVVFQSRADRYNKTPTVAFGELQANGEIPYLGDIAFSFDPTRIANDVQVTAQYGNALYRQQDSASQNSYGAITLQRTINSLDPNELTAAAQGLLLWNKQPQQRLKAMTVDPSSNPTLWPLVLGLDLGMCCIINRRPKAPGGITPVAVTGFLEQINFTIDGTTNRMTFSYQVSSNANRQFFQWNTSRWGPDPGSMTLSGALSSGATTLVVATSGTSPTFTTATGAYPMTITVDSEQITLNSAPSGSTSPQTFTGVTRSTPAITHASGAPIGLVGVGQWAY